MNSFKAHFFFFIVLGFNSFLSGQIVNRPAPLELFSYEFEAVNSSFSGQYFTVPFLLRSSVNDSGFVSPTPMIIDKDGFLVLYLPRENANNSMFRYWPDFNKFSLYITEGGNNYYVVFDSLFNPIDTISNSTGIEKDGHEFVILANGNYLFAGAKFDTVDLSMDSIAGGLGNANTPLVGFVVEEFDASGNLLVLWNSNDHLDPLDFIDTYPYNPNKFDYCHGNAIEKTADGNYLISFRHLDAIYKVNRNTGNVLWKLGGKSSSFSFINDYGFSGQHDIRELANGDISLFDNGNSGPAPKKSRALIYSLDTTNYTARLQWNFNNSPSQYSRAMGNHHISPAKFHLVNYGLLFRPDPSITLIDNSKNKIAQFYFKDSVMAYRSFIIDNPLLFSRPPVSCTVIANQTELSAPAGFNSYRWSTGDTTASILVTTPGLYQVWVNHGLAMLGSLPMIIDDPAIGCNTISIEEVDENVPPEIIAIFDLMGRRVNRRKSNQAYILQYSDGSFERVLTVKQ